MRSRKRQGFSLLELLVVLAVIGILVALLTASVQRVRAAAARSQCANHLRQLGIALHQYHDLHRRLPGGMSYKSGLDPYLYMSWHTRLLPFVDQRAYGAVRDPFFNNPPHPLDRMIPLYTCPADGRPFLSKDQIALTSYLGIQGTNQVRKDGVFFVDSQVRFAEVTDGLNNTLFVGERPPSGDGILGYWYAGWGTAKDGTADMVLGVRSLNVGPPLEQACPFGPYQFAPGRVDNNCDALHFWSPHVGHGAHFLFGDGSVRFLSYSANPVLPALSTRAGGETSTSLD